MFRCTKDQPNNLQFVLSFLSILLLTAGAGFSPRFESWPLCLLGAICMLCGSWNVRGWGPARFLACLALVTCVGQYLYVFSEGFDLPLAMLWMGFLTIVGWFLVAVELRRPRRIIQ